MKCHYEILNLVRDADDAQIKTAYRKLALKWHPDKNLDNSEVAKDQFQLVQQAYEVLSDPQERAWYDNHREQILRGGFSDYEDNALDVFPYFTVSCFKGYNDSSGGFYAVYGEVFNKIATEDIEYMEEPSEFETIPKFGNSTSDYETEVRPFYAFWESYCTKKSYAWKCAYNISEVRDRRVLKEIEKENKKVQQKHRKERNEEIRGLVSFVRKRDKRVMEYKKLLEDKALQNRLKSERIQLEQYIKRTAEIKEQQKNSSSILNDGYEEQLRRLEAQYNTDTESDESYSDDENDDDILEIKNLEVADEDTAENDIYDDPLYCIACNKSFKNESSYKNHEISKKHRDNVGLLKAEMMEDEAKLIIENDQNGLVPESSLPQPKIKNKKNSRMKKKVQNEAETIGSDIEDEAKSANINEFAVNKNDADDDDWNNDNTNKKKKKTKTSKNATRATTAPATVVPTNINTSNDTEASDKCMNGDSKPAKPSRGKDVKKVSQSTTNIGDSDLDHTCVTCKADFDSKNKLFAHLKKTNHGVFIPKPKSSAGGRRKKDLGNVSP